MTLKRKILISVALFLFLIVLVLGGLLIYSVNVTRSQLGENPYYMMVMERCRTDMGITQLIGKQIDLALPMTVNIGSSPDGNEFEAVIRISGMGGAGTVYAAAARVSSAWYYYHFFFKPDSADKLPVDLAAAERVNVFDPLLHNPFFADMIAKTKDSGILEEDIVFQAFPRSYAQPENKTEPHYGKLVGGINGNIDGFLEAYAKYDEEESKWVYSTLKYIPSDREKTEINFLTEPNSE